MGYFTDLLGELRGEGLARRRPRMPNQTPPELEQRIPEMTG